MLHVLIAVTLPALMAQPPTPPPSTQNTLGGGPLVAHELLMVHDRNAGIVGFKPSDASTSPDIQCWLSGPIRSPIPFDELIPSWNLRTFQDFGACVELRVGRLREDRWSAWYTFASSKAPAASRPVASSAVTRDDFGAVRTDYLVCAAPCDAVEIRITAHAPALKGQPTFSIERVSLALSNTTGDRSSKRTTRTKPKHYDAAAYTKRLPVPFMSQHVTVADMKGNVCSPTSLAMVLAYRGVKDITPEKAARAAYDPVHQIYGNWPANVQAAFSFGIPGYIKRFATWDEVEAAIAGGQPIIASIRDPDGRLRGTPYGTTIGHLLVICGFDKDGNVLVNDPAGRDAIHGQLTYDRKQFEAAWFGAGGVAYILESPASTSPTTIRRPKSKG